MSVYVDFIQTTRPNKNWKYAKGCHLLADTLDELHAFAKRLGLKREWFQEGNARYPHYDLTLGKRKLAVRLGATEVGYEYFRKKRRVQCTNQ